MQQFIEHGQSSLLRRRGLSRREFGRMAMLLSAGAALPFYNEAALAQDIKAIANVPADAIRLNANENPMGPCRAALEAVAQIFPQGGRYLFNQTAAFAEALAASEGLPASHVLPSAGSTDPLHRCVLAFTSHSRPLVIAQPGYEAPEGAARLLGVKVRQVPLRKDYSHDVQLMAKADANSGMIYVCNPNNPTGSVTRKEDLAFLVANKPKGCVVVIDEAYIHFATTATPGTEWVAADKDVVLLRTFSKLYGMAGLRAGAALGRPDLLEKLRMYGGMSIVPITGAAAATASLQEKGLVAERRKIVADIRDDLLAWLEKSGHAFVPSEANMVMIDVKRPGREFAQAMLTRKVAVGRSWPSMPNHVRVTIGTRDEMTKFKVACESVMRA
jgi:histidinol-phosphate aminotransferase